MSEPQPRAPAELTPRAVVIGLVLSLVMGAANVYLGLKAGMTVSASIPAAVVGSLVLRRLFRGGSVLEANQIQTAASAGESLAAGILFTMPALLLIGFWDRFDYWTTAAVAFTGGLLGILLMVPMRRVFVSDESLPYPEAVACTAVLEASATAGAGEATEAGDAGARAIFEGGLLGAIFKLAVSYVGLVKGVLEGAVALGGSRVLFFGADLSPALLAVGYIVRLEVAVLVFAGGALGWLVAIPLFPELQSLVGWISPEQVLALSANASPADLAWETWSRGIRYVGVGAMAVGGLASIVRIRAGILRALRELAGGSTETDAGGDLVRDLPGAVLVGLGLVCLVGIACVYYAFTGALGVTLLSLFLMAIASFFFVAVASYIVGLVGNSNSPVSGMTITAVLFAAGLLWLLGYGGMEGMVATLGIAAIVCCAACTSGDVCNDLRTGRNVGAAPYRQQWMQVAGVAVAALVMGPVLQQLHEAYTIGSRELPAPQAGLFAGLVEGFFGDGALPWGLVGIGASIGVAVLVLDAILERRQSRFRAHLMPIAVGIYLPFGLSVPIFIGGLLAAWHQRAGGGGAGRETLPGDAAARVQRGILFASGLVAGEALMGVAIAMLVGAGIESLGWALPAQGLVSLLAALAVIGIFHVRTRA